MIAPFRHLVFLLSCLCAQWLFVLAAYAQSGSNGPDYAEWQIISQRAERTIDAARATDAVFEAVRADLAEYRQQFLSASTANADRISTLQSQLDALGPVPETGDEPTEIANRRTELTTQLQGARAPVLSAEEAFTQADGLIREIDALLDQRRRNDLTRRGPSPLNPAHWWPSLEELDRAVKSVYFEIDRSLNNPEQQAERRSSLALVVVLFSIGTLLLVRGRTWAFRAIEYLRKWGGHGSGVWGFLLSLGRIVLPVLGIYFIAEAISATGIVGSRGRQLVLKLPEWGLAFLVLRWLCERLFSRDEEEALMPFSPVWRTELRFYGTFLAILYVLDDILGTLMDVAKGSDIARAVLHFPFLLGGAFVLFRLGQILVRGTNSPDGGEAVEDSGLTRVLRILGRVAIGVALSTPVIAALGYANLAPAMLGPTIQSLGLFGLALVLQRFFADLYVLISGRGQEARDSVVPVLIGFVLALSTLPALALIWGARTVEVLEVWRMFNDGFAIGETRISPTNFLTFAVIFGGLYMLTRLFQSALKTSLLPKTQLDTGARNAVVSGVGYLGIFFAGLIAITSAGIDLSGLAIVAGALSVGIGFGLQTIVQNFVSGIILLIERPIAEGDWIEVNGNMGYVRDISVRSTRIETFDRTDVIVPNADFVSGTVTNYTRGNTIGRVIVPVGVAYGTDTKQVEAILRDVAEGHPMILATPAPSIFFQGFGADSLDFEIRGILRDVNWVLSVKSDLNHEIAKRFAEEGIEIPFSQRDIWLRNPEVLPGANSFAGSSRHNFARDDTVPDSDAVDHPGITEDRNAKS